MRIIILLLLLPFLLNSQRSLYILDGNKAVEIGGMYAPTSPSMAGIWAAYNGPFRAELSVDKFTDSFSAATIFGARVNVPLIKQSGGLPINILGDLHFQRFQGSGFSTSSYSGAGIISHQIRNNSTVISPYGSAGYVKYDGGGDFKWSVGIDALLGKVLLGLDHERVGGFGTTYARFGLRFGVKQNQEVSSLDTDSVPLADDEQKSEQEESDAERLQREFAQADSLNQELTRAERLKQMQETERLRLEEAEAARLEQERLEQEKADRIRQQQAEMARLKREQEAILNRENNTKTTTPATTSPNIAPATTVPTQTDIKKEAPPLAPTPAGSFSVQFFASSSPNKSFDNLYHLPAIYIEQVENQELYRYKTGIYQTREEAQRVADRLKREGYPGAFVREED